jgi:hypothetical protein
VRRISNVSNILFRLINLETRVWNRLYVTTDGVLMKQNPTFYLLLETIFQNLKLSTCPLKVCTMTIFRGIILCLYLCATSNSQDVWTSFPSFIPSIVCGSVHVCKNTSDKWRMKFQECRKLTFINTSVFVCI